VQDCQPGEGLTGPETKAVSIPEIIVFLPEVSRNLAGGGSTRFTREDIIFFGKNRQNLKCFHGGQSGLRASFMFFLDWCNLAKI
jgi:hypothetical protein